MTPDPFVEVYAPDVLSAIDGDRGAVHRIEARRLSPVRSVAVGAAITQAIVSGATEALELERNVAFEEPELGLAAGPDQFVTLFLVPHNPQASIAVVRPWLSAR